MCQHKIAGVPGPRERERLAWHCRGHLIALWVGIEYKRELRRLGCVGLGARRQGAVLRGATASGLQCCVRCTALQAS